MLELERRTIQDTQAASQNGKLNGIFPTADNFRKLSEAEIKRALAEGIEAHRAWMEANFRNMRFTPSLGRYKSSAAYRDGRARFRFMHGEMLRQILKETV